ncbi:MAG: hypothetical protein KDD83_04120 [Caldilineaceae bacterium]|nr:hypothetical protein [Caldilineaceae bacterium]
MTLPTKVRRPSLPPGFLPRPRLVNKLNGARRTKLTLVAAPAGFGKTSAVAAWAATMTTAHVGWLTLDAYDDDPVRFWQAVGAALASAAPGASAALQVRLTPGPVPRTALPPPPVLLAPFLHQLAALDRPVVLVLDDYHHIAAQAIHAGIAYLLEHGMPALHLVLITRADPPLALARTRAQGMLTEVRAEDLRFTPDEAAAFLRAADRDAPDDPARRALVAQAEGWITGLRLLAHTRTRAGTRGDVTADAGSGRRFVVAYLTEEVVQQQPETVQRFLEQTSILAGLCAPLCDAVTGRSDGQAMLARLHAQDLFITPLDEAGRWFRTHHLLADLLRARLGQRATAAEIRTLHARAGRWYAAQETWEPAIDHAVHAADWGWAADLVTAAYAPLLAQGHVATWQRQLARLPDAVVNVHPVLSMRRGWVAFLQGDVAQADVRLTAAAAALTDAAGADPAVAAELAGYLATVAFFRDEPARIVRLADEALALAPSHDLAGRARATAARGLGVSLAGDTAQAMVLFADAADLARAADNPFLLAHALELVADGQFHTAQLAAAAATSRAIIELAGRSTPPRPFAANGHVKLAAVLLEQGEPAQAAAELAAARAVDQTGAIGYTRLEMLCVEIRLALAQGDTAAAWAALQTATTLVAESRSPLLRIQLAAVAVPVWLARGEVATAAAWLEPQPAHAAARPLPVIAEEVRQVCLARVRLAQGRPRAVPAIVAATAGPAAAAGRTARVIELGVVAALAHAQLGDHAAARRTLADVLALAEPAGYRQLFVDAGPRFYRLLATLPPAQQTGYVRTLLRVCAPVLETVAPADALSPRELEVLRLIAAGLSNQQIAADLVVALDTVKKHTTHIYGKLGVRGRTQAVARARELDLL